MPIPDYSNILNRDYISGDYWEPSADDAKAVAEKKFALPIPNRLPKVYRNGEVFGFPDVSEKIKRGNALLYDKNITGYKYYRDSDGRIYELSPHASDNPIDLSGLDEVDYGEIRKMLPKRSYIGGDPNSSRMAAAKRIPGLFEEIKKRANSYGVDPNLLLHRIFKEGFLDRRINRYNSDIDTADQSGYWQGLWGESVDGFDDFGLDDAADNLMSGKYELKDKNVLWTQRDNKNEKGRIVHSVVTEDLPSALEIAAADMAYRKKELDKRGIGDWAHVNAAYNGGLYWDKLNDADYVRRNYAVPNYGVFSDGGDIHIAPSKKGTFTAAAKKHGKSVQAFASQVLAHKENYSPAMVKKANFARNAAKWHSDGGYINQAINEGKIDIILAAINNIKNKKI